VLLNAGGRRVDDEREVASFMAERLHGWGLDVEYFCDSVVAADAISADIDTWDLVILDQTMPRLTGIELARQLSVLRPTLPLLLYSGYADELSEAQLRLAGVQALMKKPVDQEQLYRKLASLVEMSIKR